MSEKRDNSGTLGINRRREKESHPGYTGQCLIEGRGYWISAWVKESENGKFFSLSFKPKEALKETVAIDPELNQEIPF